MADARRNTFITALNIPFESEQASKGKYSLTLANFSFSSQQLVLSYIFDLCKWPDVYVRGILAQFWSNEHFSQTAMFLLHNYFKFWFQFV